MPKAKAKTKSQTKTVVTFLLDETGSMAGIKKDTIGGFNTYLDTLTKKDGDCEFTFIKFDSQEPYNIVCKATPIREVKPLNDSTYLPRGGTPLVDSAYRAITTTEQEVAGRKDKHNVLVVIQTDGEENASKEHNFADLKKLIERKQEEGWVFVFMGAGIDAYQAGAMMGVTRATTSSYGMGMSDQAFRNVANNTANFMASGATMDMHYTSAQLKSQGDDFADKIKKLRRLVQPLQNNC